MHLASIPEELQRRLIDAPDEGAAFDTFQELAQLAKAGDAPALAMLISYARSGRYEHVRECITSDLAHSAAPRDANLLLLEHPWLPQGRSNGVIPRSCRFGARPTGCIGTASARSQVSRPALTPAPRS